MTLILTRILHNVTPNIETEVSPVPKWWKSLVRTHLSHPRNPIFWPGRWILNRLRYFSLQKALENMPGTLGGDIEFHHVDALKSLLADRNIGEEFKSELQGNLSRPQNLDAILVPWAKATQAIETIQRVLENLTSKIESSNRRGQLNGAILDLAFGAQEALDAIFDRLPFLPAFLPEELEDVDETVYHRLISDTI